MGFIRIETVTCINKRFAFEIESEGLHKINCLSGLAIESPDKIYEICIMNDVLAVRTEDRDFRNGFQHVSFVKEDRSENNILVYDWHGTFLWNIGSVVGDIKMPFSSVSCILKAEAENEFGITLPQDTDTLLKCIAGGFTFIIDAINKKMLYKTSGQVK